jgi:hypothetical protein
MKTWPAIALGAVVLVSGFNVVFMARRVPPPSRASVSEPANIVVRHEQRMAAVARALHSRGAPGKIGYLTDMSPAELAANPRGMEEYFLTQFALVPWVVDPRADDCRLVVANLSTSHIADRLPAGFRIAQEIGHGIWLLEKNQP